jgi:hypothetical protein
MSSDWNHKRGYVNANQQNKLVPAPQLEYIRLVNLQVIEEIGFVFFYPEGDKLIMEP